MIFTEVKAVVRLGYCDVTGFYKNYKVCITRDLKFGGDHIEAETTDRSVHTYLEQGKDPMFLNLDGMVRISKIESFIEDLKDAETVIDHYEELLPFVDRAIELASEKGPADSPDLWNYRTSDISELCGTGTEK